MKREVVSSETVYSGRRVNLRRDVLRDEAGAEYVREVVEHPGAAVIVPFLPDGRVVLVRQYRHAVGRSLLELPAGTLEPDEDPAECARRELEEETGWRAGKVLPLASVYSSPGILNEAMRFFVARDLVPGTADPDPGEDIEVVLLPVAEALRRVRSGEIRDGKTVTGLLLGTTE